MFMKAENALFSRDISPLFLKVGFSKGKIEIIFCPSLSIKI